MKTEHFEKECARSTAHSRPLLPHSIAVSAALARLGVHVDSLFYAADYQPPLPHEYQFNLDTEPSRIALEPTVAFLNGL